MTIFIKQSLMNSILTADRTCDDTMAILEKLNTNSGVEVVSNDDPRANDVEVSFMYPNGARQAYAEQKAASDVEKHTFKKGNIEVTVTNTKLADGNYDVEINATGDKAEVEAFLRDLTSMSEQNNLTPVIKMGPAGEEVPVDVKGWRHHAATAIGGG